MLRHRGWVGGWSGAQKQQDGKNLETVCGDFAHSQELVGADISSLEPGRRQ